MPPAGSWQLRTGVGAGPRPALLRVEGADQLQQAVGAGVEVCGELGDLIAERLDRVVRCELGGLLDVSAAARPA